MSEDTMTVGINYWGGICPFRGQPHVSVDSRCPTSLKSVIDFVDLGGRVEAVPEEQKRKRGRPRKDEVRVAPLVSTNYMKALVPVMQAESYCEGCLANRLREREMGINFTTRKVSEGSQAGLIKRKRGRPRKNAAA